MITSNRNRIYKIGGYDVSAYVIQTVLPNGVQAKPEWGELPEIPRLTFQLFSHRGQFNTNSANSIFYGVDVTTITVDVIFQQGALFFVEWSGMIENLVEDYEKRTVDVIGVSEFAKSLDSTSLLTTGTQTPATLSKQLFELFNIPVDEIAYAKADSLHENLIAVQFDPNLLDSQITLMEAQKLLATAGYGRIYSNNGAMVYEVYSQVQVSTLLEIHEWDLMSYPKINNENRTPSTYTVQSLYGQAESVGWVVGSNSKNLDFGANSPVKITALTGAQVCADQWENIDNLKQKRIEFCVLDTIGSMLDLTSYVNFNWESQHISNINLEIISIDRTDPRYTQLVGRSV